VSAGNPRNAACLRDTRAPFPLPGAGVGSTGVGHREVELCAVGPASYRNEHSQDSNSIMRMGQTHYSGTTSRPRRASLSLDGGPTARCVSFRYCENGSFDVCFVPSCSIDIVRARTSSVWTARSLIYPSNVRRAPSMPLCQCVTRASYHDIISLMLRRVFILA
jgi:hypothetical protein